MVSRHSGTPRILSVQSWKPSSPSHKEMQACPRPCVSLVLVEYSVRQRVVHPQLQPHVEDPGCTGVEDSAKGLSLIEL
jgi:hypothetical protein